MITNDADLVNRFGYHRANETSAPQHAAIRELFLQAARVLNDRLPQGRDASLALTHLQEAMHWSNSAIAMQNPVDLEHPERPNA